MSLIAVKELKNGISIKILILKNKSFIYVCHSGWFCSGLLCGCCYWDWYLTDSSSAFWPMGMNDGLELKLIKYWVW
jgi:hypothetical protein